MAQIALAVVEAPPPVVCGKLETSPIDPDAAVNPKLVIEVLSDSTEAHDRGTKASHYRCVPSLEEPPRTTQSRSAARRGPPTPAGSR